MKNWHRHKDSEAQGLASALLDFDMLSEQEPLMWRRPLSQCGICPVRIADGKRIGREKV